MLLPVVSTAALGCEPALEPRWAPELPEDGAPVNVAVLTYDDEDVELEDASGALVELVRGPLGPAWAWRPVVDLDAAATYTARIGTSETTFTTGDEALDVPPPPRVEVVDQHDVLLPACGTPLRSVDLDGEVEGVLLAIDDSDRTGDGIGRETSFRPVGLPASVEVDHHADALRFGTVDAAGQWSGWSEPVDLGGRCGCAGAGPGAWTGVLPLVLARRRR